MERMKDESFDAYKIRRNAANLAVKRINRLTKKQRGLQSARTQLREAQKANPNWKGGTYGANIIAMFASRRPDLAERQEKHRVYLLGRKARAEARELAGKQLLKAA